jgi:outer membrane lipase/esterase
MGKTRQHGFAVGLLALAGFVGGAQASPYSDLVIFGDSLSDTGNVLALTAAFAPPSFPNFAGAPGRFSNGPVWTETLAAGLGLPNGAKASNLLYAGAPGVIAIGPTGGTNYAFGGARTGLGGSAGATTGLFGQLIAWNGSVFGSTLTRTADSNALYVLLAGANDLRDARNANGGATAADAAARSAAAATVATNLTHAIGLLAQAGARHFLVPNLPDLGKTPEAIGLGKAAASTDVTLKFNTDLAGDLAGLDAFFMGSFGVDLDIRTPDLFGQVDNIYDDAVNQAGAIYGITNVSTPCIAPVAPGAYFLPGSTDLNCSVSAFSDDLHPSAATHLLIGQLALATAVPEPGSLLLVLLALLLVLWHRHGRVTGLGQDVGPCSPTCPSRTTPRTTQRRA